MDIQGAAQRWLADQLEEHASVTVDYVRRDGLTLSGLPAVFGTSDYKILADTGVEVGATRTDFFIDDSRLGFTPALGDEIVTGGRRYRVVDHGADGCWSWANGYCYTRRIHTEYIGADN